MDHQNLSGMWYCEPLEPGELHVCRGVLSPFVVVIGEDVAHVCFPPAERAEELVVPADGLHGDPRQAVEVKVEILLGDRTKDRRVLSPRGLSVSDHIPLLFVESGPPSHRAVSRACKGT